MRSTSHSESTRTRANLDWKAVCSELVELGREVVENWEQGDLALAVNKLRVAMDEIEQLGSRSNARAT